MIQVLNFPILISGLKVTPSLIPLLNKLFLFIILSVTRELFKRLKSIKIICT